MQQPPQGPYQPGYPQQPGGMQPPPPRKPRKRKKIAIGCGTLFLLFIIIGSCNAIINGGKGATSQAATSPAAAATMQQPKTVTHKQQPKTVPTTAPTHAVPIVAPTPAPTQPPAPTQAPAPTAPPVRPGVNGNPWGYDFNATGGSLIYQPNPSFCDSGYFTCVSTFWKDTNGYVSACGDGKFTHSGGVSGECSRNGGKGQILYSH
jgi:hypothetical protein